jgi:hypothetical protein
MYDVQVAYPDIAQGTSAAVCEVYLREEYYDPETGETIDSTVRGPVLTTVVDQSRSSSSSFDDGRFMSIGEITADNGGSADRLSVVVKVSSAGAEYRSGRATLVLADAVRVDRIE